MLKVQGKCSACGAALEVAVGGPFAGAELAAPLCAGCSDRQFLADGGVILALRHELDGVRFLLGKVTITCGAVEALSNAGEHAVTFLARHVRWDWGAYGHCDDIQLSADEQRRGWEATDDTGKINKWNLLNVRGRDYESVSTTTLTSLLSSRWPLGRSGGLCTVERRTSVPGWTYSSRTCVSFASAASTIDTASASRWFEDPV